MENTNQEQEITQEQPAASAPVTEVPAPNAAPTAPAKTEQVVEQGGQDWSKKYESLEKSYSELRRKLVEQGTEKNQYQKQFESLNGQLQTVHKAIAQFTKKPFEFGQFLEDLQARGPEALFDNIKEPLTEQLKAYEERIVAQESTLRAMQVEGAVERARSNEKQYPDFTKLEAEMVEIYNSGQFPFDASKMEPREVVDKLYNLARLRHSEDALKAAEQIGKQKAEKELAREAQSAVAGGGKPINPAKIDPKAMSAEELRAKLGVAERD